MKNFAELRQQFLDYLHAQNFNQQPQNLYEPIGYMMGLGGKRVRPVACLMAYQLFKNDTEKALPIAMCVEMFHNFSLVHDDVMDEAPIRRGKPTVEKKYGLNTAILSGDMMLVKTYEYLGEYDKNFLPQLLKTYTRAATEVCEGQQFDMDFEERNNVTVEEYLEMIRQKTAVLLAASLKMGAIIAETDENTAQKLYDFGINIGLAFQLKDDLLDTYGGAGFGKQEGGDIIQNKKTFLMLTALSQTTGELKKELETLVNTPTNPEKTSEKVTAVKKIYESVNIATQTENLIEKYHKKALNLLAEINVPEERKSVLKEMVYLLMGRKN